MLTLTAPLLAARSMLPLSERMRLEHFGDSIPPANSRYRNAPSKRQLDPCTGNCLTEENTRPIRLRVDYASLDPETAPPYAACFQVGEWYARGLPGPEPPADPSLATCRGLTTDQDCWGICKEADLITPTGRAQIKAVVDQVVAEVASLFAVRRPAARAPN